VLRAAGADWALLPHTAGFIDPLHSTGIAHTMSGIERLMSLIEQHWDQPPLVSALEDYSASILHELTLIDQLVGACYRASGSFRLFTACTMLYFAGVITTEQHRLRPKANEESVLFLNAGDQVFVQIVQDVLKQLDGFDQKDWISNDDLRAFESYIEHAVAPYNSVGLFHPPVPNMYHHTAAR
jgi:FADH2 O2-dependent halogenase